MSNILRPVQPLFVGPCLAEHAEHAEIRACGINSRTRVNADCVVW